MLLQSYNYCEWTGNGENRNGISNGSDESMIKVKRARNTIGESLNGDAIENPILTSVSKKCAALYTSIAYYIVFVALSKFNLTIV